jgi:anti-anti-sigma factor
MSDFNLHAAGDGRWRLSGRVDFNTAPAVWEQLRPLLSRPGSLVVSLAGVRGINSAGLGLLLEGMAVAREAGCEFRLVDVPVALKDLAGLSNVGSLLGTELAA